MDEKKSNGVAIQELLEKSVQPEIQVGRLIRASFFYIYTTLFRLFSKQGVDESYIKVVEDIYTETAQQPLNSIRKARKFQLRKA